MIVKNNMQPIKKRVVAENQFPEFKLVENEGNVGLTFVCNVAGFNCLKNVVNEVQGQALYSSAASPSICVTTPLYNQDDPANPWKPQQFMLGVAVRDADKFKLGDFFPPPSVILASPVRSTLIQDITRALKPLPLSAVLAALEQVRVIARMHERDKAVNPKPTEEAQDVR